MIHARENVFEYRYLENKYLYLNILTMMPILTNLNTCNHDEFKSTYRNSA